MRYLASTPSQETALRRIRRECPPDALPAAQLARTLQRSKVYLLSRMDPSLVEDLDMIPVAAHRGTDPAGTTPRVVHSAGRRAARGGWRRELVSPTEVG